ncbi:alkaline phosphatase [Synechococcus sp. UW140]|uniref:alkaline phosphatase n=1 Tax=Synechococcus sp. UW140 TaxID=368503 RepID=UPI003137DF1C
MAKNVILIIGDGMGWEMARSAAIYNQVEKEITTLKAAGKTDLEIKAVFASRTLDYYYTSGKGTGTPYQDFSGFTLATTGSTKVAGSTNNSALEGSTSTHDTGDAAVRAGFAFDPSTTYVNWDSTKGGETPWDSDYYQNRGKTSAGFDAQYIKADYPDSANTASTLYGGVKTYNGAISVDIHEHGFESILTEAKALGKSGGVVTSVPITHATPAAAVANVNSRNKYQESSNAGKLGVDGHPLELTDNILDDILFGTQPQIVFGGGNPAGGESYVTTAALTKLIAGTYQASEQAITGKDGAGKNIFTQTPYGPTTQAEGWTVVGRPDNYTGDKATKTGLQLLEEAVTAFNPETQHLMGIYGAKGQGGNLPWRTADNDYSATGTGAYSNNSNINATNSALTGDALAAELKASPTVAQLAGQALKALGKDKDGFWLMVEVGDIDWAAHADNMDLMLGTLHDMDDVVSTVTAWVKDNGGWENNQVMVTADHDHYLTLLPNFPKEIAESILASKASTAAAPNEATSGVNTGYDTTLTPTLTNGSTAEWKAGDAEKVGHFWGTEGKLKDGTTGLGDLWTTHTQRPVPIYYKGADSVLIDQFVSTGIEAYGTVINGVPGMIDQAHVAFAMEASLLGGASAAERLATAQDSVVSPTLAFTSGEDLLEVANPAEQLTFKANVIFTGGGADVVDSETNSGFRNTIFTGSADDVIYAGSRDVITGGSGDDEIWATAGNGNRLSGNGGGDDFIIGTTGNRALGGDGNDTFAILEGAGTNYLNGGAGSDQFWLISAPGDKPAAKQFVMDFTPGEDKVGLRGYSFADLSFTQAGSDTLLTIASTAVGHFSNTSASALNNVNNFAF